MTVAEPIFEESSSSDAARRVDALCDAFEEGWQSGSRPEIDALLEEVPEALRWTLLRELLLLDIRYRLQPPQKEPVSSAEYERRFPLYQQQIARVCQNLLSPQVRVNMPAENEKGPPFRIGDRMVSQLDDYELLVEIGKGGMGYVYKARHALLGKLVALKVSKESETVARFRREMSALGKLNHPNITTAYDASVTDIPYLVMEYIEGLDLRKVVEVMGPLRVSDACEILRQAAEGLQHAHEHGLVHRDIKPNNLLLSAEGVVKVLDLGLARVEGVDSERDDLTGHKIVGTYPYMAPEQASDARSVDIRCDLYSLGCTLYHLLSGMPPYTSKGHKLLVDHLQAPIPAIRKVRTDVPEGVAWVIERLLAKSRDDRPATPADLTMMVAPFASGSDLVSLSRVALEQHARMEAGEPLEPVSVTVLVDSPSPGSNALTGSRPEESTPATEPMSTVTAVSRRPLVIGLAAALAVLILGGLGWGLFSGGPAPIDLKNSVASAGWEITANSATSPRTELAWLRLPVPATASGELSFLAERLEGQRLLIVHVHEESPVTIVFEPGLTLESEATTSPGSGTGVFTGNWGDWSSDLARRIVLEFAPKSLRLNRDGTEIFNKEETLADVSALPPLGLPDIPGLYLGTENSRFKLSDIRWAPK